MRRLLTETNAFRVSSFPNSRCVKRGSDCVYLAPRKPGPKGPWCSKKKAQAEGACAPGTAGTSARRRSISGDTEADVLIDEAAEPVLSRHGSSHNTPTPLSGVSELWPEHAHMDMMTSFPDGNEAAETYQQQQRRIFPAVLALCGASPTISPSLNMLPNDLTLPSSETIGALVQSFWTHRSPIYMFLHRRTFVDQVQRHSVLLSAMCLGAIQASEDAEIQRNSTELQSRFLANAMTAIRAMLDVYLPLAGGDGSPAGTNLIEASGALSEHNNHENLDHLCEVVFAICMVNDWANYRGMATLHAQLTDIVLRLSFAIGLHRDPPETGVTYGFTDSGAIFIRKAQRRSLWFIVAYFVLFRSHYTTQKDNLSELVVQCGENSTYSYKEEFAFHVASQDRHFDPTMFRPPPDPDLKRPLRRDDIFLFTNFPRGSPERQLRLGVTSRILADEATYNWGPYFAYWRLRVDINTFLRDCVAHGTTPGKLVVLDTVSATMGEARLIERARTLDATIVDLLDNLPPIMKEGSRGVGRLQLSCRLFPTSPPNAGPHRGCCPSQDSLSHCNSLALSRAPIGFRIAHV